jgi:hypothetical protein
MNLKGKYEAHILVEDNQILCCSQMCTQDCSYFGRCKPCTITVDYDAKEDTNEILP